MGVFLCEFESRLPHQVRIRQIDAGSDFFCIWNSMDIVCKGNCAACPLAREKGEKAEKCIKVAVVGIGFDVPDETVHFRDYSINFIGLREISGILDIEPDIVLDLVDALRLEDTLYPVTKLIDMDLKVIMAFQNYRKLLQTGHSIKMERLSLLLGMPVLDADYNDPQGRMGILGAIAELYRKPLVKDVRVPYGQDIEEAVESISAAIHRGHSDPWLCFSERYLSLRLLEHQDYILPYIHSLPNAAEVLAVARKSHDGLELEFGEASEVLVAKARRGFVAGALQETLVHGKDSSDHSFSQKLDSVLTSRWLGFPIMVLILFGVFQLTFTLGAWPQGWIEQGVNALCVFLNSSLPEGWLSSMLVDGVIQGVGAVISFLPNIVIMFFLLSLLEDSGYMSRAAFLMDKTMHLVGLHGRSFIPMLIGFGCNVPAIMAAKNIDNRRDRALTMLMIPFMSCSARLPVYLLFVSAFFPGYKALVMMSMYVIGILLSILFAFVMKHTKWFRKGDEDYVQELPPFRMPTWRNSGMHVWERVSDYLKKISTVILASSVVIWALEYFPVDRTERGQKPEESCLAMVGKAVEPLMRPLGFDWKMNVALLTGLPAKEAIVSTMGILYHAEGEDGSPKSLPVVLREEGVFNVATAWAFMLFVLLYFPCLATVSALRKEVGTKWAAFTVVNSLVLAWVLAWLAAHLIPLII